MKLSSLKLTTAAAVLAAVSLLGNVTAQAADARPLIDAMQNQSGEPSLAPMLKNVIPAVVNISVKGTKTVGPAFDIPEEFRFMFPQLNQRGQREFRALGSGVIIDAKKGYIVTNYHVVDDANQIRVALSDGREFEAKKIGADSHTDLALLQLKDFSDLTALPIANSNNIEVGDFVVAIGNPFGLGQTVTSGIVSALGRTGLNIENIENFIQTDAAINSGNSGGALVNLKGELVGINTAILGPNGGNIGIGFAIPADMVQTVVDQLKEYGEVRRGTLGVAGTELTADIARNFGYKENSGAFVNEVIQGGAAQKAGIKPGDIIIKIDDKKINSFGELRALIATKGSGKDVKVTVFRDGKEVDLVAKLQEPTEISGNDAAQGTTFFNGTTLSNHDGGGVEITDVAPGSLASRYGIKKGDIITKVNRDPVNSISELKAQLAKTKGKSFALFIQRGDMYTYITIQQ